MPKSACGLVLIKKFTYRGDTEEEWSNKYWLTGVDPGNSAAWKTLADDLIALERACYAATSRVVRAYGYNDPGTEEPGSKPPPSVWSWDYELAGSAVAGILGKATGEIPFAGDQAGIATWQTDRRSKKGHPIYLRKFFHDGFQHATLPDEVSPATQAEYQTFAGELHAGIQLEGRTITDALNIDTILGSSGYKYITTHTLKRRGKRP